MLLDKVYVLFHYNIHFEGLSPEGALTSVIVFKIDSFDMLCSK